MPNKYFLFLLQKVLYFCGKPSSSHGKILFYSRKSALHYGLGPGISRYMCGWTQLFPRPVLGGFLADILSGFGLPWLPVNMGQSHA